MSELIRYIFIPTMLLVSLFSCKDVTEKISLLDEDRKQNGLRLKEIVLSKNIKHIVLTRPFGYSIDTTFFDLNKMVDLYGERLFTLGNEKFICKDIDSIAYLINDTLKINSLNSGYDNSGPFTQEFVSNFWEGGNGYLLNKKLPSFKGKSYSGELIDLDSLISKSEKTFLHFGWLGCGGCMKEQNEITKLIHEKPEIKFVNMTIDKVEQLDKYLIDKGEYFDLKAPYNRLSKSMIKPILLSDTSSIFEYFHLKGAFPVNFLVDKSGKVEKIGRLFEIFSSESDSVEVIRID